MKIIPVLLIAIVIILPITLVDGISTPNEVLSAHITGIGFGNRPFTTVESFHFGFNHLRLYKHSGFINGFASAVFHSPVGDNVKVNYSVSVHNFPYEVNFIQPSGYIPENFQGSRSVDNSVNISGFTSFKYVTVDFLVDDTNSVYLNGANMTGVTSVSGDPVYNISLSSDSYNYNLFLPGFAIVEKKFSPLFIEFIPAHDNLFIRISYGIHDGMFNSFFYYVISSSNSNYASQYLSVISSQGQFFNLYPFIEDNFYSIVTGAAIFLLLMILVYITYRRK